MKKTLVSAATAVVLVLGLSGCFGQEKVARVTSTGEPARVSEGGPSDVEGEAEAEGPATASLGDVVSLPGWEVKVTDLVLDAEAQLRKMESYFEEPSGKLVLVTYEATYNGSERTGSARSDLDWSFSGTDNQVRDDTMAYTQADKEDWPTETRAGGTVKGQVVFDVPGDKIKGGLLSVEAYDENYDKVYADFKVD